MHMLRKGQMRGMEKGDILGQVAFISALFGSVMMLRLRDEHENGLQ